MDLDDAEDEVLVEYPLFSSNEKSLFSGSASAGEGRIRLVNMHYPLRSPMRPYNIYDVKDVSYKRNHRVLSMTVPEDRPDMVCLPLPELVSSQALSNTHIDRAHFQAHPKDIPLTGTGLVPEVPLCAMVKVEGSCVLVPIDEVTRMRPDMSAFVKDGHVRDKEAAAAEEDPDYKPKTAKAKKADVKPTSKAVKVSPPCPSVRPDLPAPERPGQSKAVQIQCRWRYKNARLNDKHCFGPGVTRTTGNSLQQKRRSSSSPTPARLTTSSPAAAPRCCRRTRARSRWASPGRST